MRQAKTFAQKALQAHQGQRQTSSPHHSLSATGSREATEQGGEFCFQDPHATLFNFFFASIYRNKKQYLPGHTHTHTMPPLLQSCVSKFYSQPAL